MEKKYEQNMPFPINNPTDPQLKEFFPTLKDEVVRSLSPEAQAAWDKHYPAPEGKIIAQRRDEDIPMSVRYPKYYKPIPEGMKDIDIYGVCKIFEVVDTTGCLHHTIKKLLLPGVRTGGKSRYDDIKEARDTLNRWLEINK